MSLNAEENAGTAVNVIIRASIADTKRYSHNNKQILNHDKAATKEKKKRNRMAGKRSTVNSSDSRRESEEKKKHRKRNHLERQILLKMDIEQDPRD